MKPFSSGSAVVGRVSPAGLFAIVGLLAIAGLAIGLAFVGISVADAQVDQEHQVNLEHQVNQVNQEYQEHQVDQEHQSASEPDVADRPPGDGGPAEGRIDANHPLLKSAWLVEDIDNGGVLDRLRTFVQLAESGRATGSTGLNRFNGKVTLDADQIKFGPMATTRRGGPPAVMDQESKFIKAIAKVRSYKIDENGLLRLLDEEGKQRMRLSPIDREDKDEKKSDQPE